MKRISTAFLQAATFLVALAALAFLLWEPHLEGRNAHATLFEVYFKDPFLAYAYFSSLPFFAGLYHAFKALGYVKHDRTFSPETLTAVRTIKRCALALIGLAAVSVIFMLWEDPDDRPAGVFMRLLVTAPSILVAAAAAKLEQLLQARPTSAP